MFNYIDRLETIEEFKTIKEENEKVVFLFSASWCPDCLVMDMFLEDVVKQFPEIKFSYVDRDKFPEIVEALDIFGIPSFVAYKNNEEASRFVSKNRKTKPEVEEFLRAL